MKRVLITGITGQDGAYLAKRLLDADYEVFGAVRRGSTPKTGRLRQLDILDDVKLLPIEITEFSNVFRTLKSLKPAFIYNLAAQSFVQDSFLHPLLTSQINYLGVLNLLESINLIGLDCQFYQASTSEMYGDALSDPQSEDTPFNPMSPYAVAKCAGHHLVINYRVAYGLKASNGILFNHESELRGREFVTRKISHHIAALATGRVDPVELGNVDSIRDWGYAPDFVEAMQLINEHDIAGDYVVATNRVQTVRDFVEYCARTAGFDPAFEGEGLDVKCMDRKSGRVLTQVNEAYFRPSDVTYLRGDYSKVNDVLGWQPTIDVEHMAERMTEFDLGILRGDVKDYGV